MGITSRNLNRSGLPEAQKAVNKSLTKPPTVYCHLPDGQDEGGDGYPPWPRPSDLSASTRRPRWRLLAVLLNNVAFLLKNFHSSKLSYAPCIVLAISNRHHNSNYGWHAGSVLMPSSGVHYVIFTPKNSVKIEQTGSIGPL
jgi:hypothetical protein